MAGYANLFASGLVRGVNLKGITVINITKTLVPAGVIPFNTPDLERAQALEREIARRLYF